MNNRLNKVKILILNQENEESKGIQTRLKAIQGQLPAGVEFDVEKKP